MKIVQFHSTREGVGKTRILANLMFYLAQKGKRVGAMDCDVANYSLFKIFNRDGFRQTWNFAHLAANHCAIGDLTINLRNDLKLSEDMFLFGMSKTVDEIFMQVGAKNIGNECDFLHEKLKGVATYHRLDYLFFDAAFGFSRDTLLFSTTADWIIQILCPNINDYEALFLMSEICKKWEKRLSLVLNQVLSSYEIKEIRDEFGRHFPGREILGFPPFLEGDAGQANLFSKPGQPEADPAFAIEIAEIAKSFIAGG